MDHSPVDLPNILSRSKLHSVSQSSSSSEDSDHQYFANLHRNIRVRADSDSFQINSENIDTFQQLTVSNNGSVERRPLTELRVLSPDTHSIYSDDRYIMQINIVMIILFIILIYLDLNLMPVALPSVNQHH